MSSAQVSSLEEYLKKNKMQVRLVIYYSGMSGYVVDIDRRLDNGGHLASGSGPNLEEALRSLEPVAQALLEKEKGEAWQKSIPKSTEDSTES